jgi:hypothetical protein
MTEIGLLNNRQLVYQRYTPDLSWVKTIPDKNWLLFVIVEGKDKSVLNEISDNVIDRDVCYACCIGEQGELLHDMIDNELISRELGISNHHMPPFEVVMTTWHNDLDEAFWFSIFAAYNDPHDINTIFCLDTSEVSIKSELEGLVKKYITEIQQDS